MSDDLVPDLDPGSGSGSDEDQVRQLLAAVRHTEPMPADVADRIDAALASLALEATDVDASDQPGRPGGNAPAVPDLATVRRRRTARNLLVAAAAVVVVGIGLGQLDLGSVTHNVAGSDSGAADSAPDSGGSTSELEDAPQADAGAAAVGQLVNLNPDRFGRQVRRLAASADTGAYRLLDRQPVPEAEDDSGDLSAQADSAVPSCIDTTAWGPGARLRVRYAGHLGVLIFRPKQGQTQVVDLYLCHRAGAADEVPTSGSVASEASGRIAPVRSITLSGS